MSDALLIALVASPFIGIGLLGLYSAIRGEDRMMVERARHEGRHRFVRINGTLCHAIRTKETIMRKNGSHALAVLTRCGLEGEPTTRPNSGGKTMRVPRWIEIRSITKKGLSERARWVSGHDWKAVTEREIEYHIVVRNRAWERRLLDEQS